MPDSSHNPYAPPVAADEAPPFVPPATNRGLRVSGGVVLLLVGIWSAVGGSCSVAASQALRDYSEAWVRALPEDRTGEPVAETRQAVRRAAATAPGLRLSGSVILSSGVLCLIAGVLFFFDRGRVLGLLAVGVGVVGELLFFALVAFNAVGVAKLACLGFGGFCATRVGLVRAAAAGSTRPAPPPA